MRALGFACFVPLAFALEALAAPPVKQVVVTNFPNPENVVGSVEVTNLPKVQDVRVVNPPLPGGAAARFQLIGFTAATFTGAQGVLGFTLACQQEFPNSRMCTSLEILETTAVPADLAGEAWVRPTSLAGLGDGTAVDPSGVVGTPDRLTCISWRGARLPAGQITTGLVVDAAGRFRANGPNIDECGVAHSVACCAPVQ